MRRLVLAVALVAGCQAAAPSAGGESQPPAIATAALPDATPTAPSTPEPTPPPTPAPPGLGTAVQAGDWTITINSVKQTASNNIYIKPDPGNVFWVVDATLVNNGTTPAAAGSGITLQDDADFAHNAEFLGVKKPELGGNVPPGSKTRGYLTFQMAKAAKPRAVLFQPDIFNSSVVVTIALS